MDLFKQMNTGNEWNILIFYPKFIYTEFRTTIKLKFQFYLVQAERSLTGFVYPPEKFSRNIIKALKLWTP